MDLVTQAEFARRCKVSAQAISKAIKNGQLRAVADGKKKKIDMHDALSVRYISDSNSSRQVAQEKKGIIEKTPKKIFDPFKEKIEDEYDDDDEDLLATQSLRDQKVRAQIVKLKVETAHKLGLLIERSLVEKSFDRLTAVILNYLFPLGDRLSPKIAGMFESTEQEKINEIKVMIDKEMMRGLDAFKDEASKSIVEWKKKK